MYGVNTQLERPDIILNNYSGAYRALINIHILVAKFYLYRCRVQNVQINFQHYITDVNNIRLIERVISLKNNNLSRYCKKWRDYD